MLTHNIYIIYLYKTTAVGFEPTRAEPMRFLISRLRPLGHAVLPALQLVRVHPVGFERGEFPALLGAEHERVLRAGR